MNKQEKYEKEVIDAIIKNKWMRWAHIDWAALSFSRKCAYDNGLHNLHSIKEALELNRSKGVNYLIQKWITSENATLQIAAMRIIADDDDRARLNQHFSNKEEDKQEVKKNDPMAKFLKVI